MTSPDAYADLPESANALGNGDADLRFLPWVVAAVLLMEQLDATIVNTGLPAMAAALGSTPLNLKAVVTSYVLSLGAGIPISGWLANRFGTREVFLFSIASFTLTSILCGLATSRVMLVAMRVPQGLAAAMMLPVGRMAIVRTFPKAQLLRALNFVIVPALIGPLLGPPVGGLIVHLLSWHELFFVNVPIGIAALWFGKHHMPEYREASFPEFDWYGLAFFGTGLALLSWLLEISGEHRLWGAPALALFLASLSLLGAYAYHAKRTSFPFPLLQLSLLRTRTFRIAALGGFITRHERGGMPLLLPLTYQLGLAMPAWQSGLLMVPVAATAMVTRVLVSKALRRFGHRRVLIFNTVLVGLTIGSFCSVGPDTTILTIVALGTLLGLCNSVQFTSTNSLAYADIEGADTVMATTLASTLQQVSTSFGVAIASLIAGSSLAVGVPQSGRSSMLGAVHDSFLAIGLLTILSSLTFRLLRPTDGASISGYATHQAPGTD